MLYNCSDINCILHQNEPHLQHHLQDDRQHHTVMSSENNDDVNEGVNSFISNGTDSELSSLEHVDVNPSEAVYIICGVVIAMLLVGLIIILLAVTISKLRKRDEENQLSVNGGLNSNSTSTQVANGINNIRSPQQDVTAVVTQPQETTEPEITVATICSSVESSPDHGLNFLWDHPKEKNGNSSIAASSQFSLYTNDQEELMKKLALTEPMERHKSFRKSLRGKWQKLIRKKQSPQEFKIPEELRYQLKQIYVY